VRTGHYGPSESLANVPSSNLGCRNRIHHANEVRFQFCEYGRVLTVLPAQRRRCLRGENSLLTRTPLAGVVVRVKVRGGSIRLIRSIARLETQRAPMRTPQ
jgi:hypothetical protein